MLFGYKNTYLLYFCNFKVDQQPTYKQRTQSNMPVQNVMAKDYPINIDSLFK